MFLEKQALHYIFFVSLTFYEFFIYPTRCSLWLQTQASPRQSEMHSSEVWWHFSRCIIHGTHLFSTVASPSTLPLCFVFCHVPSPCNNYSLQGPSIHCDRAPLWWSGLCLSSHSWTFWMRRKSTSAGVMLIHFSISSHKYEMSCHFSAWYIHDDAPDQKQISTALISHSLWETKLWVKDSTHVQRQCY